MTHRVSPIDDHRRIVPGRASGPAGGGSPAGGCNAAPPVSRRAAAHPPARTAPAVGRPAFGGARTVTGRLAAVPGRALATYR
ncbi:hypothetical protein DER29_4138 [Micromonospora sp. M71_S20]|uniref:hypothetical protein n=1 Tax=Micromonospora sp. M71_S20 TaxID=592872 RepID=UPI000EB0B913|nr:hypothetical protein [Micromonospora sp. M71_S20]RLK26119.1 hypothetical protein DER29_4138 [Micromonospora sp. M71_S20]